MHSWSLSSPCLLLVCTRLCKKGITIGSNNSIIVVVIRERNLSEMIFIRIFGDVRKSSTHVPSSFSSFFLFDITNVNQVYLPSILVKQAKRRNRKILFASSNNLLHRCQFERKNAIESTKKEQKMKRRERSAFKFLYYRDYSL